MARRPPGFPLFNRIVVLIFGLGIVLGTSFAILQTFQRRKNVDPVQLILMVVFCGMGCGGIWLSLLWRQRTSRELAEELSFPSADQPQIAEDAAVCQFSHGLQAASISIERCRRMIHFHNCHIPRTFLARPSAWFSCPVDEIQGVHIFHDEGESLTVVTLKGKAVIPAGVDGYEQLRDTLRKLVPSTAPRFLTDHPVMGWVYVLGATLGSFAGAVLTPRGTTDTTLGLFVLGGSVLGAAAGYLVAWGCERLLKRR